MSQTFIDSVFGLDTRLIHMRDEHPPALQATQDYNTTCRGFARAYIDVVWPLLAEINQGKFALQDLHLLDRRWRQWLWL